MNVTRRAALETYLANTDGLAHPTWLTRVVRRVVRWSLARA